MIESPLIKEIETKAMQRTLLEVLKGRFSEVPPDLAKQLRTVQDQMKLLELATYSGQCPSLEAFRARLLS
jgi:hypothetical protein